MDWEGRADPAGAKRATAKPLTGSTTLLKTSLCCEILIALNGFRSCLPHLLLLEVGYELGEKADEVKEDDDGAVEVRRVPAPTLPGLQGGLARLHLAHRPLEHLYMGNNFLHLSNGNAGSKDNSQLTVIISAKLTGGGLDWFMFSLIGKSAAARAPPPRLAKGT